MPTGRVVGVALGAGVLLAEARIGPAGAAGDTAAVGLTMPRSALGGAGVQYTA